MAPKLTALRCYNHGEREAAALCTRCRKPQCRECVTEHAGQVLCRGCLGHPSGISGQQRSIGPFVAQAVILGLSIASLLLVFVLLGKLLTSIPQDVHEGTVWQSDASP